MTERRKRKNFTKRTIAERYLFCGGRCEGKIEATGLRCNAVVKPGDYHADHDNPDGITGDPTFENCRILCIPCHDIKTKKDRKNIDEAQRREQVATGADRVAKRQNGASQIKSAGFPKVEKAPRNGAAKIDKSAIPPLPPRSLYRDI